MQLPARKRDFDPEEAYQRIVDIEVEANTSMALGEPGHSARLLMEEWLRWYGQMRSADLFDMDGEIG